MRVVFKSFNGSMRNRGFTLIEMLVVIGIIAIVTMSAIPSLKGIYRDFRVRQTLEEVDTFITGMRSHYLIMNAFPEDCVVNQVKIKEAWCLPRNFYSFTSGEYYNLVPRPYGKKASGNNSPAYDIDSWLPSKRKMLFTVRYLENNILGIYKTKLQQTYSHLTLDTSGDVGSGCVGIPFPEINGLNVNQYR